MTPSGPLWRLRQGEGVRSDRGHVVTTLECVCVVGCLVVVVFSG